LLLSVVARVKWSVVVRSARMSRRVKDAFRAAVHPSLRIVFIGALIVTSRWSKFADPVAGIAVVSGLILIVFLTYFALALTGFRVSPRGIVDVPRIYVWSILCAIVVLVFGALFYVLRLRT